MDPDRRRILMMSVIIVVGVVLILFDVSLSVLLALTALTGLIFLGASGSLKIQLPAFSRTSRKEPVSAIGAVPMKNMKEERPPSFIRGLKGVFGTLAASLRGLSSNEQKKMAEVKKIDEMLDALVPGNAAPSPLTLPQEVHEVTAGRLKANMDIGPLKELSNATLEDDLLPSVSPPSDSIAPVRDGEHLNPDTASLSVRIATPSEGEEKIPKNAEGDFKDLKKVGELEPTHIELKDAKVGANQSLMSLSSKDSKGASSDIRVTKKDAGAVGSAPTGSSQPETPVSEIPKKADIENVLSLTKGSKGGDDLLLALKSEVSQVKKPKDMSLFREMKDSTVTAPELRSDLEQISSLLTSNNSGRKRKELAQGTPHDGRSP